MPARLLYANREGVQERLLLEPRGAVVGSAPGCGICFCDARVRARHARVFAEGTQWYVERLEPTAEVAVGGRPLAEGTRAALSHRDRLSCGPLDLVFLNEPTSQSVAADPAAEAERLRKELGALREAEGALRGEVTALREGRADLLRDLGGLRAELRQCGEERDRLRDAAQQLQQAQQRDTRDRLAQKRALAEVTAQRDAALLEAQAQRNGTEAARRRAAALEKELEKEREEHGRLSRDHATLEGRVRALEDEAVGRSQVIEQLQKDLEQQLGVVVPLEARAREADRRREEAERAAAALREAHSRGAQELERLRKERERDTARLRDMDRLIGEQRHLRDVEERLAAQLGAARSELQRLQREQAGRQAGPRPAAPDDEAREAERLRQEVVRLTRQVQEREAAAVAVGVIDRQLTALVKAVVHLEEVCVVDAPAGDGGREQRVRGAAESLWRLTSGLREEIRRAGRS